MSNILKKILIEKDELGNPYIHRAWDVDENKVVSEEDEIRPSLIIENDMVIQIEKNGLDIEIPEFDPFPANSTLGFLIKKNPNEFSEGEAWLFTLKLLRILQSSKLGDLKSNYEVGLEVIEDELSKLENDAYKEYILKSLNARIDLYKKTGIWDLTPTPESIKGKEFTISEIKIDRNDGYNSIKFDVLGNSAENEKLIYQHVIVSKSDDLKIEGSVHVKSNDVFFYFLDMENEKALSQIGRTHVGTELTDEEKRKVAKEIFSEYRLPIRDLSSKNEIKA